MPIISGPTSGPEVASGALVSLQNASAGYAGGSNIPLDTVEKDTASYWDATNHRFVIPTGLSGLFVVSLFLQYAADATITSAVAQMVPSGAAPNCEGAMVKDITGLSAWRGVATYVVYASAGDVINTRGLFSGPGTVTLSVGCFSSIARIGSLP